MLKTRLTIILYVCIYIHVVCVLYSYTHTCTFMLARVLECPIVCGYPLGAWGELLSSQLWGHFNLNTQLTLVLGFEQVCSQGSRECKLHHRV